MISSVVNWLVPDDLWSWIAVVALALLVTAAWLVPAIRLSTRVALTAGLVAVALIGSLWSLWQGEVEAHAGTQIELRTQAAEAAALKKRNTILEREAMNKVRDDETIKQAADELKDKIDEAAQQASPGASVHPAIRAVDCARMLRAGQAGTARYRDLCQ